MRFPHRRYRRNRTTAGKIKKVNPPPLGAIAQLGERIVRNDEVVGSIPTSSTNLLLANDQLTNRTNLQFAHRFARLGRLRALRDCWS